MSDPTPIISQSCTNSNWLYLLAGAGLALIGSSLTTVIKMRLEKKQEIQYIKTGLIDEIGEISSIIGNMLKTQETAKSLPKVYLDDLLTNTESFNLHRKRLFLIGNKKLRKEICDFYKKLEKDVKDAGNAVGTLDETNTQQTSEVAKVVTNFTAIKSTAINLETSIDSYKYKSFWVW